MGTYINFRGDDVVVPDEDWLPAVGMRIRFHSDNCEWVAGHEFTVLQAWNLGYDERTFILRSERGTEPFIAHSISSSAMTLSNDRLNEVATGLYPMPALNQREFREFVGNIIACVSRLNEHADDPRFAHSEGFLSIMGARYDSWTATGLYADAILAPRTSLCLSMRRTRENDDWSSDDDWLALPSSPRHPWTLGNWALATLSPVERGPNGNPISLEHTHGTRIAGGRDPWVMQPRVIALPWWDDEPLPAPEPASPPADGWDFIQRGTPAYRAFVVEWGLEHARSRFRDLMHHGDDSWFQHEREQPPKVAAG